MKYTDYVMKSMASCLTLDDLEDAKTRRYFIERSGTNKTNLFKYRHSFGQNSNYRHQLYDHNYQRHAPILRNSMGILGIFGAIVPEFSQKQSSYGMISL